MSFNFSGVQAVVQITGAVSTSFPVPTTPVAGTLFKTGITAYNPMTVYTPTAGKTGYITSISVLNSTAGNVQVGDNIAGDLADGNVHTNAQYIQVPANTLVAIPLSTPLKITGNLKFLGNGTGNLLINYVGYEA